MARVPEEDLSGLLKALPASIPEASAERTGLSKRQILKMIRSGAPEGDILKAIGEQGSRASLDLDEAVELKKKGTSPALLAMMVRGSPAAPSASPVPPGASGAAVPPGPPPAAPTLDELLPQEKPAAAPTLDQALGEKPAAEGAEPEGEEGEEAAPTLEEALGEEETAEPESAQTYYFVLSDPPEARLFLAPASARVVDLLKQGKSAGRAPARIEIDPGAWYLLVEKKLDGFDESIVPALRTVLDGDGRTRTLIESGDIVYDAQKCCLPKSMTGTLSIARITEDQQGTILGDEFGGLPPYLWDGNRYLILSVREGRIRRAIKVYEIRKSIGESRTLSASFVPTSTLDPLAPRDLPAEKSVDEAESAARESWGASDRADLDAVAKLYGIPEEDSAKIPPLLKATGKAIWKQARGDGSVLFLSLSLDSSSRIRADEYVYRKDGPFGMLSTPAPPPVRKKKKGPPPPPDAAPLADLTRHLDPEALLPVLSVSNQTRSAVLLRLMDGTIMAVAPGGTREMTVSPGSGEIVARFPDKPADKRKGKVHFTYHARYSLRLD